MNKLIFLVFLHLFLFSSSITNAIYDPLSRPNNKIGIHILFPSELNKAKELVNSSGGEWGYVTIPIQIGEKDIAKWQIFLDDAKDLKLIPILRLATEGDYFIKSSWKKPTEEDILDFANFMESLNWPVKNKYIIIFNEVNRSDEWNGQADPEEYAKLLSYATTIFKEKDDDYFIISSGMDNASITANGTYSQYDYFELMNEHVPGIFNKIDGISSHAYPNPGFAQPPEVDSPTSISSFIYESDLINSMSDKRLPIFITETGWDQTLTSDQQVGQYFIQALETTWNHPEIVAITPFLLNSGPGPFEKFSFLDKDGKENNVFKAIKNYKKVKGEPAINSHKIKIINKSFNFPVIDFSERIFSEEGGKIKFFVLWLLFPL